jgi:predicted glycoside hydrolase/deacetylase ChbG (UPF0249 family)
MTVLIHHADDLGITAGATESILKAWRAGALDGFSIIANGDALQAVREGLEAQPDREARIALHFNLTEGPATAPREQIPLLVDESGRFRRGFGGYYVRRLLSSAASWKSLTSQVETECRAQIRALREICGARSIRVVDGHNHIHMIPGIFEAVSNAARAESLPEIRVSREAFHLASATDVLRPFWWINLLKHLLLRRLSRRAVPAAKAAGLRFPDYLVGVLYTGHMTAERAKCGIAAAGDAAQVEVVFHVGQSTPGEGARWGNGGYAAFHLSPNRNLEYDELLRLRGISGVAVTPP